LNCYLRNLKGITLLEVLISMTILMFGILGLIGLMAISKQNIYLIQDKEYISLEIQSIFENISLYEGLKEFKNFKLHECDPIKNENNKILLNRAKICKRLQNNLGEYNSSQSREINLNETEFHGKKAIIKITNDHDKKTHIYSRLFAVK